MKNQKDSKLIIFVRHGQAENNTKKILAGRTPGISLTEKGIAQAESSGKFIKSLNISKIYSSPVELAKTCLLYTSDAADDTPCVDLGGRRII